MREIAVTVYDDWGEHTFAQARYFVSGLDDVQWTNDKAEALRYLAEELDRLDAEGGSS